MTILSVIGNKMNSQIFNTTIKSLAIILFLISGIDIGGAIELIIQILSEYSFDLLIGWIFIKLRSNHNVTIIQTKESFHK